MNAEKPPSPPTLIRPLADTSMTRSVPLISKRGRCTVSSTYWSSSTCDLIRSLTAAVALAAAVPSGKKHTVPPSEEILNIGIGTHSSEVYMLAQSSPSEEERPAKAISGGPAVFPPSLSRPENCTSV